MRPLRTLAVLLLLSPLGTVHALADAITFFNTGISASGSSLAAGASDSHYSLIYNPDGVTETATATVRNLAWTTGTNAGWISNSLTGSISATAGYYIYETTLNLTGYDPTTAVLMGAIAADDSVSIYLNHGGTALFSSSGYSSLNSFTISSGFVSGVNLVDFVVSNNSGPTGLLVDHASATASAITPEPAALLLAATGVFLVWGFRALGSRPWSKRGTGTAGA